MNNWKEITQYSTAIVSIASGIVLSFLQFFDQGDLSTGVLTYVGQSLIYAGSIFGVAMYWNGKYSELKSMVRNGNVILADNSSKDTV